MSTDAVIYHSAGIHHLTTFNVGVVWRWKVRHRRG